MDDDRAFVINAAPETVSPLTDEERAWATAMTAPTQHRRRVKT